MMQVSRMCTLMPLLWATPSSGHVVMTKPGSRNFLASQNGGNANWPFLTCPHCLNMGSKANVQAEQTRLTGEQRWQGYPESEIFGARHSVCGGEFVGDESFNDNGEWSPLSAAYTGVNQGSWGHDLSAPFVRGGEISFDVEVNAHHLGHFEFYLCDKADEEGGAGADTTLGCLNMHRLERAPDAEGELSPTDPNHPERYYIPPVCSLGATGPALDNPLVENMRYSLPTDVTCEHCVVQMVYVTANNCNPVGYGEHSWPAVSETCPGDDGARDWWNGELQDCADGGYPEEFWNCADIRIVESSDESNPTVDPTAQVAVGITAAPSASVPSDSDPAYMTSAPTWLGTGGDDGEEEGPCVSRYGTCDGTEGPSPCCGGEGLSCYAQSPYYSQCLTAEDCAHTDWCNPAPGVPTASPTAHPSTSPQAPTASPSTSPQPPTPVPPPTTGSPTRTIMPLTTTAVGDSYERFVEFLDELTSTLDGEDGVRVVHSEGGAAGGVVSEGQGYGLLIGGATAASLASSGGVESEEFEYAVATTLELLRGWQKMCKLSDSGASCQGDANYLCTLGDEQVPCLPHWKFDDDLTAAEGTGAAVDGDEDAILGMILLLKAVEPLASGLEWYEEVALWTHESSEAFFRYNTIASDSTGAQIVRLGSCWGGWDCNNPSYHAPAAMKAMGDFVQSSSVSLGFVGVEEAAAFAENVDAVVDVTYEILLANQCPSNGLTTNWYVPVEDDPSQTGTTGCSGSGTPAAEFGSEASRGVWRVALDYMLYGEARALEYMDGVIVNLLNAYRPANDASSQWGDLTSSGSGCLVDSVHASWQWNAFMFGPVFSALVVPQPGASDLNLQMGALDSAAARIRGEAISGYYSGSWVAISTLTLNGDFLEAGSLLSHE